MEEISVDQLKRAIETQHGGCATFSQAIPVRETFQGRLVWVGAVHVFDLTGHPKSSKAYAWSSPIEGSTRRRFFAVLQLGGIQTPQDAVKAAIVAELRTKDSDSSVSNQRG